MLQSGFLRRRSWHLKGLVALAVLVASLTSAGATWGASGPSYDPAQDTYSLDNVTSLTGAQAWWDAGYTGKGIDVAVIDSGVSPVAGLSGKVVYGPDLSLESQNAKLRNYDSYGHGTFMAGLIAGRDSFNKGTLSSQAPSVYRGMAPDARIISLKVATADGGTDVTQVIAAINWVVQHAKDPGYNIRVINLSYGTNSTQSYKVDPLAYATEQAWKKGIVVVAAAGNQGYQNGSKSVCMANPAYDPSIIAVSGADTMGTSAYADDQMGAYSSGGAGAGQGCKAPDFAAPGSHMQGLRVVNSFVDQTHSEGRLSDRYFRGSGTSQSAAITSGAVALVLQKYPNLTPDQVKYFIQSNATGLLYTNKYEQGAGALDLAKALKATPGNYVQTYESSTGTGSLEESRGTDHLTRDGVVLQGEKDIFGKPFDSAAMATLEANASSWSAGTWNGSTWSGSSWSSGAWAGSTWSGSSWSGSSWSASSWSSQSWCGSSWSGNSWSGSSWSGSSWSGGTWAGGNWLGASWD